MLDLFAPINQRSSWAAQPPGKLVMRAPVAPGSTVELYIVGKALDLESLAILRNYLDLMEKGLRLSTPPDTTQPPAQQPNEGE